MANVIVAAGSATCKSDFTQSLTRKFLISTTNPPLMKSSARKKVNQFKGPWLAKSNFELFF